MAKNKEFLSLVERAIGEWGIKEENIANLDSLKCIKKEGKDSIPKYRVWIVATTVFLILAISPALLYKSARRRSDFAFNIYDSYFDYMYGSSAEDETCLVGALPDIQEHFRPPIDCSLCAGVTEVHRVTNLSHADFLAKYAYSMQPVIVKDGQNDWKAKDTFSFDFFRNIYSEGSQALEKVMADCQFFPYRTEFDSLGEMLNMSKERLEGNGEPWYVGWSNCDGKVANLLRKHYNFPYFLPPILDHSKTDWIFMGLPGYGAFMHIDSVGAVAWQAQVRGIKKWTIEAPAECAGICTSRMEIIVEPGDIIVIDADKWYHSTLILGNDTSIVIGSEFY